MQRTIPAPDAKLTPESEPFWQATAAGKFILPRCTACGRTHWYPRALCPFCFGPTEWVEASGDGVIYSYSVMRRAAEPYAIAYVTLAEGPTMLTNIVDADLERLAIGQTVTLALTPTDGGPPVPCFRPATKR